jgi:hypothetical protein
VPRIQLACCRAERDGDLMVARLSRAALRLLSGPTARAGYQRLCLHGMGNRPPTRRGGGVHTLESRHVVRLVPWPEETYRARRRLVRGGSSSGELVGGAPN